MTGLEILLSLFLLVAILFAVGYYLEARELNLLRQREREATLAPQVPPGYVSMDHVDANYVSTLLHETLVSAARTEAIANSRAVNKGFVYEEMAPHWQKGFDPKDFHHMGAPIDYLVIDGANDFLEGRANDIRSVVLFEVKTGNARMSKIQRLVRDAVKEGRVRFIVSHIDSGKEVVSTGKAPTSIDPVPPELEYTETNDNGETNGNGNNHLNRDS